MTSIGRWTSAAPLARSLRATFITSVLALTACPAPAPEEPSPTEPAQEEPAPTGNDPIQMSKDALQQNVLNDALVPSPVETQKALEAAGLETKLADLIAQRDFKLDPEDTDGVAVRTGVVMADMLLTVKSASDEQLTGHLDRIAEGLKILKGGDAIQTTITDLKDRIKGQAVSRDELVKELDELTGAIIPELEFNGVEKVTPLIQAGGWLEGSNLVARACKDKGDPTAADTLLKQPVVVDYFIRYVKTEGADKAPEGITLKLEESLNTLKGLASKAEPLTLEDVETIIKVTDDVLAIL